MTKTYNKVIINNETLIDLSEDTVEDSALLSGYTAHDRNGAAITGSLTPVTDVEVNGTSVVTSGVAEIDTTAFAEIVFAEYGVTSYSDILTAIGNGKVVMVVNEGILRPCVISIFNNTITLTTITNGSIIEYYVNSNGWSVELTGYVPNTRTVNSKALSSNITLSASDVGAASSSHAHGNITNAGDITGNVDIASGDRLVINDESASNINNSSITFGSSTSQYLANNGTWQNVPSVPTKVSDLVNDSGFVTTDTKNTAGSTQSTSKLYLIGATSQGANPQTYSNSSLYYQNGLSSIARSGDYVSYLTQYYNQAAFNVGDDDYTGGVGFTKNSAEIYADGPGTGTSIMVEDEHIAFRGVDNEETVTYYDTSGTSSAIGTTTVSIGNNIAQGTAKNRKGLLTLFGSSQYATTIDAGAPTSNRTITLPNSTGTVALTSDLPTVNNATLTIQKNSTTIDTFTANSSVNKTVNIEVHDIPSGGTSGQVLAKASGTDYDVAWTTPSSSGVTGIKGNSESSYRSGDVNLTLTNLGVHISTSDPTSADGNDGDVWFKYELPPPQVFNIINCLGTASTDTIQVDLSGFTDAELNTDFDNLSAAKRTAFTDALAAAATDGEFTFLTASGDWASQYGVTIYLVGDLGPGNVDCYLDDTDVTSDSLPVGHTAPPGDSLICGSTCIQDIIDNSGNIYGYFTQGD